MARNPHEACPSEFMPFIRRSLPFSELPEEALAGLARHCAIDFVPKGTRVFIQGETVVDSIYLIQSGGVRLYLSQGQGPQPSGEEKLVDYRGEGGSFGALAIIRGSTANLNVDTIEDSFFFRIPKDVFESLVESYPSISQYYLKAFSEGYVSKAFAELRQQHHDLYCADSGLYLFSTRMGDLVKGPPVTIEAGRTIRDAAGIMAERGIGSLLVLGPDKAPGQDIAGIVTDKDLRRAMAEGEPYDAPVEFIMSSPVATVGHHETCFDGLLRMMAGQIHHLAVVRPDGSEDKVMGMVTSHDIMVVQGRSPLSIFRDILGQRRIEGLYDLSNKVPWVTGSLMEEGAKAGNISRMIAVLNDLILEKLLTMLQDEMGPPPAPWCWILMGSEGRREQTFRTDQDNALVYLDPNDEEHARACEAYFKPFTEAAIQHLVQCGYPLCPGDMMASNEKWRQPHKVFRDYFERMILNPEPEQVLGATIFFDFRPGFGSKELGDTLRGHVTRHASRQDVFLRYLARDCLATRPPLSFFRNFIVEKDGEHKNTFDIKEQALTPFVDFARVMALKNGIRETNTMDRLRLLAEGEHISSDLAAEAAEAYEFLMQVRLVHQMRQINDHQEPDNRVNPAQLTDLEKRTVKEAFRVVTGLQNNLKDVFRLNVG